MRPNERCVGPDVCSCCGKPELVQSTFKSQNKDHAGVCCACAHPYFWRHFIADRAGRGEGRVSL